MAIVIHNYLKVLENVTYKYKIIIFLVYYKANAKKQGR